ncbi:MAG: fumarylacetoacetate hydrolase family protein [Bacteroidales bacterium]|nr:fumarylacetoacetate hydrolase family protein [Bacteroidales bacterium]MBR2475807.1 fumarylacetoacetate hydrolase family protein [Bacteroidaceae bacterium]
MKIFAVGWNYNSHNKEMDNTLVLNEPVIFLKPESAILKDGKPFFYPDWSSQIEYEAEIVVRIDRLGKNIQSKFAYRYYNSYTIGIDFTARDYQAKARANGNPWDISKGFDGSAVVGDFIPTNGEKLGEKEFYLNINGNEVQRGNSKDMIFSIDDIVAYVSKFYTLKKGDLIYTGTPSGVGGVKIGDRLEGFIGDEKLLDFHVR